MTSELVTEQTPTITVPAILKFVSNDTSEFYLPPNIINRRESNSASKITGSILTNLFIINILFLIFMKF